MNGHFIYYKYQSIAMRWLWLISSTSVKTTSH